MTSHDPFACRYQDTTSSRWLQDEINQKKKCGWPGITTAGDLYPERWYTVFIPTHPRKAGGPHDGGYRRRHRSCCGSAEEFRETCVQTYVKMHAHGGVGSGVRLFASDEARGRIR